MLFRSEDDGQDQEYLPDDMRGEQDETQQMEITLDESDEDTDDQDQMEADEGMPPPEQREVPISDADPRNAAAPVSPSCT